MAHLTALEGWSVAALLRTSGMLYPLVSALHIVGIGLLFGSIAALDLQLAGLWKPAGWRGAVTSLSPVAGWGLGLALVTGFLLFSVRATRYADNPAMLVKAGLIGLAMLNILLVHRSLRRVASDSPPLSVRVGAAASLGLWVGVIFAGRWIAFVE